MYNTRADLSNRSLCVRCGRLLLILASAGTIASAAVADDARPPALGIADFDFRDTSGEVTEKTEEHEAQLKEFNSKLRSDLSENEDIEIVALKCQDEQCTARTPGVDALSAEAKSVGVRYILFGEIHKMSTLVGWVRIAVLDVGDNKPVCDRLLSYRGDTDEAWRRAAVFAARDIERNCIP